MSAPCTTVKPSNTLPQLLQGSDPLDLFQAAHQMPDLTRQEGANVILEALRQTYEALPADADIDQTARAVALCLKGDVNPSDLNAAYDLWLLRHQIADPNGDLEYLLDLPNTEANRDREVANAEGNLMAAVAAMLDKAGVK
ncbi:hypothetical protein HYQ19_gp046 [Arthrobacter phage DrYang]|uniref:Uncharacterized protein n=1 Tax=Arthrobacter phage DrYang TaxID=2686080 RepID=A0A6B9J7L9_9CAUD|nr:hypothetical protein HYQ19_gp046 [Arthrobacter phage DrYang]QGZ17145.1 hypothetical protein SEA_DRYANG_46 [Arthrobacter phage DrYang]